jgi:hypothetical protein
VHLIQIKVGTATYEHALSIQRVGSRAACYVRAHRVRCPDHVIDEQLLATFQALRVNAGACPYGTVPTFGVGARTLLTVTLRLSSREKTAGTASRNVLTFHCPFGPLDQRGVATMTFTRSHYFFPPHS